MSKSKYILFLGVVLFSLVVGVTLADYSDFGENETRADNGDGLDSLLISKPEVAPSTYEDTKSEFDSVVESTVTIYSEDNQGLSSQGSGFMYTDKHIITNEHVIDEGDDLYINYENGEWSNASITGQDRHSDIAVLKPETIPEYAEPIPVDKTPPKKGDSVIAVGSPGGLDNSITDGVVSGLDRSVRIQTEFSVPDSIQTDAALNPGNSGGPLVSLNTGGWIGVNRATEGENIGFAVSAQLADRVAKSLIKNGEHRHPFIGIRTTNLNPLSDEYGFLNQTDSGLIVQGTTDSTPASGKFRTAKEDKIPDLILQVDGNRINDNEDIASYLMINKSPNEQLTFQVLRDNRKQNVSLKLASRDN